MKIWFALAVAAAQPQIPADDPVRVTVIDFLITPDHEAQEHVVGEMEICADNFVDAEWVIYFHNPPALKITLNESGKEQLAKLTATGAGSQIVFSVGAAEVLRAPITEPLQNGTFELSRPRYASPGLDLDALTEAMQRPCGAAMEATQ
jgi:hypothetical protein